MAGRLVLLATLLLLACFVGPTAATDDPTLLGRIITSCMDTCNRLYHDKTMCGTEEGQFCAWVHHLKEDDHLFSIETELEAVTNIDKANGDNAISWAMEELVQDRHKHKELDDHTVCEDFTNKVGYMCMGMQSYHARQEEEL